MIRAEPMILLSLTGQILWPFLFYFGNTGIKSFHKKRARPFG
jgi:hypothetical protein